MNEDSSGLKERLAGRLSQSDDYISHRLEHHDLVVELFYLKSITDEKLIREYIIMPVYRDFDGDPARGYIQYIRSVWNQPADRGDEDWLRDIIHGNAVIIVNGVVLTADVKLVVNKDVSDAKVENSIFGARMAFSENLETNMNLIRSRYYRPTLTMEKTEVGVVTRTPVTLIYDREYVDPEVLKRVKQALVAIKVQIMQSGFQLQRELAEGKRTLVPTVLTTERPDRATFNIAQGKIILLLEGSPFATVVPVVFYDFISAMDDFYAHYWVTRFLMVLRYFALFVNITLAAMYVTVTSYNPELLRVQLAFSIAGSRAPVPYPSYFEVLFMLVMMELLSEASVRLPKVIGSTATTVGGLILGQAASQAGLVSNIMIIIVTTVAISNYVITLQGMGIGLRVVKYLFLAVSTLFGLLGLAVSLFGFIAYLAHLDSFGQPYLKLFREKSGNAGQIRRME